MLKVHDIRQTRVYQEAMEEGRAEEAERQRQRSLEEKLRAIPKLAALHATPAAIADILGLDEAFVREQLASHGETGRVGGKAGRRKGQGGARG